MRFHDFKVIKTDYAVWRIIKEYNIIDLVVFTSYSSEFCMETCYGIKGADYPLMCAKSEWDHDLTDIRDRTYESGNHAYWLCVPEKETPD